MTIIHIAGPALMVGDARVQRCSWCGTSLASAQQGVVWVLGTLVAVGDGAPQAIGPAPGDLPDNCCARMGIVAADAPGNDGWTLLGMPIGQHQTDADITQPESALVILKTLDTNGKITYRVRSTEGLTTVEAYGMAGCALKKFGDLM